MLNVLVKKPNVVVLRGHAGGENSGDACAAASTVANVFAEVAEKMGGSGVLESGAGCCVFPKDSYGITVAGAMIIGLELLEKEFPDGISVKWDCPRILPATEGCAII